MRTKVEKGDPDRNWGLGVATVTNVDYEEFYVTLKTVIGTSQEFDRVPVPMTFPGAGARHFFGSMPEIGDRCVVGWMPQESSASNTTRTPVILAWVIPGVWPGRDWVTTAEFDPEEYDMDSPQDAELMRGVYQRVRHKLRHMQPGNIVASSSQGSDLVLDEGVTLSNRRGNEIRLRDQDQAIVVRSLQQFHAMAGARVYAGMVQRDARRLPAMVVSDGKEWDALVQANDGAPIPDTLLGPDSTAPDGFYTPAKMFQKRRTSSDEGWIAPGSPFDLDSWVDPYMFLQLGGILDGAGFVVDGQQAVSDAVYGGKPIFRVAQQDPRNATNFPDVPTLTEIRFELAHTSDGRLPVTEQTDLFDAERLPDTQAGIEGSSSTNQPFVEWVLGSVVGNDPYSVQGRQKYGLPIVPVVFEPGSDTPAPRLEAAKITSSADGLTPTPLTDHAALLFHLVPPTAEGGTETFWAVNKSGQLRAYIGGDTKQDSAEIFLQGGLKFGVGGACRFLTSGSLEFGSLSKGSLHLNAEEGAVTIYGGGPVKTNETMAERISGSSGGEADVPAVDIGAKTNLRLSAERKIVMKGGAVNINASAIDIVGNDTVFINGTKSVELSSENFKTSVSGQMSQSFSGPKYLLPTNFPLHERSYVSPYPGFAGEKVSYVMCDREETFKILGNHTTTIQIGNMIYQTILGTWKAQAAANYMELTPGSASVQATAGPITLTAAAGAITATASAAVVLTATGGPAVLGGLAGVFLRAPITGPDVGPILCAGSLEPFTNLPFATWGLGAKLHNVTV
jgi:hypothetical protein